MHITHSLVCSLNSSASSDGNTTLISLNERGFCNIGNAYRYLHNCRQVAIFPGVRRHLRFRSVSLFGNTNKKGSTRCQQTLCHLRRSLIYTK